MDLLSQRKKFAHALLQLAQDNEVTHWGTLKIGLIGRSRIDTDRELLKPLGEVVRAYSRVRNNLPNRARVEKHHLPFMVGTVEQYDRAGSLDPHLHYFIRLRKDEEPRYRGFLRSRFGRDCTDGAASLPAYAHPPETSADWSPWLYPEIVLSDGRPSRPIIKRLDARPTFDLQALYDDGFRAANYAVKQGKASDIVSHLDFAPSPSDAHS